MSNFLKISAVTGVPTGTAMQPSDLATITLTGNVTGSGSGGSISTTIASSVVTLSMLANLASNSVIGNSTGSPATPTAVPMVSTATGSSVMFRDTNANVFINNIIKDFATTATSTGTTTLTVSSSPLQQFTGTTTQTVDLPNATTLTTGWQFEILNRSTGTVTVKDGGGTTIQSMIGGSQAIYALANNGTTAGSWDISYTTAGGNAITALTGQVTASGPGSATATIATNTVTNSNLAQMAADTIKGNNTSGTANAADLTVAQVLTLLGIFAGKTSLSSSSTTQAVTFSTAYANTSYSVTANLLNTTDTNPQFQPIDITAQSTTGFTASWNSPLATANYVLSWRATTNN
jgi:hypothetical protein